MQDIKQNLTVAEWARIKRNTQIYAKELPATLYQLFTVNPYKKSLSQKQIWSIENILRNALKKHPHVKVFIVVSSTGKNARRVKKKVNGRYRTFIKGRKVPVHVHIGVIGDEQKSAKDYVVCVAKRLSKAGFHNKIKSIKDNTHAKNHINYCYKQADSFHQYGNPNFNFFDYALDDCTII
jgi:hypothetical protein